MKFPRHKILSLFLLVMFGVLLIVLGCFTTDLFIITATNSSIYYSVRSVPPEQAALVLGASVYSNGTLSSVLKERADAAAALYESGVVGKILVSGDDGTLQYDEVYPIGKYLEAKGIPRRDIFLDYAGFDTYSSMYRARAVFDVSSMVITTQRFHLPRALFLARVFGISAVGLDSSLPGEKYFDNSLREIPASVKALLDVLIARVPKYLGQQYPITGDGRVTWVASTTPVLYFPHGTQ